MPANVSREIRVVRITLVNPAEKMIPCVGLDAQGNLVIDQAPSIDLAPFFEVHQEGSQLRLSLPGLDQWVTRSGRSLVVRGPAPDGDQNARFYFESSAHGLARIRVGLAHESLYWAGYEPGAKLTLTSDWSDATQYVLDFVDLKTSGSIKRANIGTRFWNDGGHSKLVDETISHARGRGVEATAKFLNKADVVKNIKQGLHDADYESPYAGSAWPDNVHTWSNHFYAPDDPYPLLFPGYFRSGLEECLKYSQECRDALADGDETTAGYKAGLALHFLTDLTQPMHAANFGNYFSRIWGLWGGAAKDNRHTEFEEAADRAFAALGRVPHYSIRLERPLDSIERRVHACAVESKIRFNTALRGPLHPNATGLVWEANWMREFVSELAPGAIRRAEEFLHILIAKPQTPVYAPPLYIHSAAKNDMVLDVNNWGTELIIHHKKDHDPTNQQWVVLDAIEAARFYLCPMFKKTWAIGGAKGTGYPLKIVDRALENESVLQLAVVKSPNGWTIGVKDYVLDVKEAVIQDRTNVGLYQRYHPPHTNQEWIFKNGAGETVSLV